MHKDPLKDTPRIEAPWAPSICLRRSIKSRLESPPALSKAERQGISVTQMCARPRYDMICKPLQNKHRRGLKRVQQTAVRALEAAFESALLHVAWRTDCPEAVGENSTQLTIPSQRLCSHAGTCLILSCDERPPRQNAPHRQTNIPQHCSQ